MSEHFEYQKILSPRVRAIGPSPRGRRLNLVMPGVDVAYHFGGLTTAIRLFKSLAADFDYARLISINSVVDELDAHTWGDWIVDPAAVSERSIAFMRSPSDELPIFSGDYFMAFNWTTAILVKNVVEQQRKLYPRATGRRYIFFIQEFDPGFHQWSYEYFLARSSYDDTESAIALFNMGRFRDYFRSQSIHFKHQFVFEPRLHPEMLSVKSSPTSPPKERLILAYARPALPRNAFPLIVESLRSWARTFETADQWSVVSWGAEHEEIELSKNVWLRPLGRLLLRDYALVLSRCWVGLSFVFMAHPAFSRLDFLEFGAWLITNSIPGNDLSDLSPKVLSMNTPTPDSVSERLAWCCNQFIPYGSHVWQGTSSVFSTSPDELPDRKALIECLTS